MVKNKEYQVWEATATGKSHRKVNNPCQDSVKTQEVDLGKGVKAIIAALSDGAGSARKSVAGSKISVKTFIKEMEREIRYFSHYIESDNDKENENNQLF